MRKTNKFTLKNLETNLQNLNKDYGKKSNTLEKQEEYIQKLSDIINNTLNYHISLGDITQSFAKDFRSFLAKLITVEWN